MAGRGNAPKGAQVEAKPKRKGTPRPNNRRPPYKPTEATRRQVTTLAGLGLKHEEIAAFIDPPCDDKTLRKYFRRELSQGMLQAKVQTLGTLHRLANGAPAQYYPAGHANAGLLMTPPQAPDRACLIFKCKTAYGMRETVRIGGEKGGAPINLRIEDLSEEQLVQLLTRVEALEAVSSNSDQD